MRKGGSKKFQSRRIEKPFVEMESEFKAVFVAVSKDKLDFSKRETVVVEERVPKYPR